MRLTFLSAVFFLASTNIPALAAPPRVQKEQICDASALNAVGSLLGFDTSRFSDTSKDPTVVVAAACKTHPEKPHIAVTAIAFDSGKTDAKDIVIALIDTTKHAAIAVQTEERMMRFFFGCFLSILASVSVGALDIFPAALRDKEQKPIQTTRQFSVNSPEGTGLSYSVTCRVKLVDPFFGYLTDDQYFATKFPVNLTCYREDEGTAQRGWARFDATSQTWQPNLDPEEAEQLKGAFRFYPLQAVNRSGWAVTVDDISGDESARRRTLHYCLINPPKALCGYGDVGYLKDGRKGDLTDYALKILRSIEFHPEEPVADGGTAPAASESGGSK